MSDNGLTRRRFLQVATAAGTVASCSKRAGRQLIPYVTPPDDVIPGQSRYYQTVCRACSSACGMMAETRDGRLLKLEGNPSHPINVGALCLRGQAAIEGLYDPQRLSGALANKGGVLAQTEWDVGVAALADAVKGAIESKVAIAIVTRTESGAMRELLSAWLSAMGQKPDQLVMVGGEEFEWAQAGRQAVFSAPDTPIYEVGKARVLLSIGSDFLDEGPSRVELSRGLAQMRANTRQNAGRFVYVGPRLSMTAAAADEWLAPRPGSEIFLVLGLAKLALAAGARGLSEMKPEVVERLRASLAPFEPGVVAERTQVSVEKIEALAQDFIRLHPSLCLGPGRVVGGTNAVALSAAVNLLNAIAGNHNETLVFMQGADTEHSTWTLSDLRREIASDRVGLLLCHHANVLAGRQGLDRSKIKHVVTLGNWSDETAGKSDWVLADHHFLEAWGEVIARPGVRGAQQASTLPLRGTRAAADVLLDVARRLGKTQGLPDGDWATFVHGRFSEADLELGGVFEAPKPRTVAVTDEPLGMLKLVEPELEGLGTGPVLVLFSSNKQPQGQPREQLLQEIPDPVTTIAWSGWCELHPEDAMKLGATNGDVMFIEAKGGTAELPIYVHAGVARNVLAVPAAFGCDLIPEGTASNLGLVSRAKISRTGRRYDFPHTDAGRAGNGSELSRRVTARSPLLTSGAAPSMYPAHAHQQHRWGMTVDLDRCTGCSACVAACYVENNVPIVGAEEVALSRDMAWLRIDRFLEGPPEKPEVRFLPVMCQQCCNAPCETVCPTYTTYHTSDGLNAQIYNRCVGTRYCENNCPYTVRRFNFWDAEHPDRTIVSLNPDVTLRQRGVVEKCTFCVQRIRDGKENAKMAGREVVDGEIVPACAQSCPTQALVFGDLKDPHSRASILARERRAYSLLEELNTEPGVRYLARIEKGGV